MTGLVYAHYKGFHCSCTRRETIFRFTDNSHQASVGKESWSEFKHPFIASHCITQDLHNLLCAATGYQHNVAFRACLLDSALTRPPLFSSFDKKCTLTIDHHRSKTSEIGATPVLLIADGSAGNDDDAVPSPINISLSLCGSLYMGYAPIYLSDDAEGVYRLLVLHLLV